MKKIAIIGGGAGGIFASLRCADWALKNNVKVKVTVFESSPDFLRKVRISGGGRCNVTHHIYEPKSFCENYPRGKKELLSPFYQFQSQDTVEWFKKRGVNLKYESDGRMFPVTDKSSTIIDCFLKEASKLKVDLLNKKNIKKVVKESDESFTLYVNEEESYKADAVLLSTGSKPLGYEIAKSLGHSITDLAPSLFTFIIKDTILEDLSGTSFLNSSLTLKIKGFKSFKQKGPLLITHKGLSGPALLKLSAWAAREMKSSNYQAKLIVNWLGLPKESDSLELLIKIREQSPKSYLKNASPLDLTNRFWGQLLKRAGVSSKKRWNEVSKSELTRLVKTLFSCELDVRGKNRFKDEFVECGGVDLKEIDFKTMESKICKGLYFSGEVMDVDGITGGFNFQNAWTSGWLAGENLAKLS